MRTAARLSVLAAASAALAVFAVPGVAQADAGLSITGVSHTAISSNGGGFTSTDVTFTVSASENVAAQVFPAGSSTAVRTVDLGTETTGDTFNWDGTDDALAPVDEGTYTVTLTGTDPNNSATVLGTDSVSVTVDNTPPSLTSVTGGGTKFYPYPDGYKDTFRPTTVLSEPASLALAIKNSNGHTVRTITASKSAGTVSLTWNGRNSSNNLVAAGTYTWTFKATNAAGNSRSTLPRNVYVSAKKLVKKTKAITHDGTTYFRADRIPPSCTSLSKANSAFDRGGVLITASCKNEFAVAAPYYKFTIPSAVKYGRMTVGSYGFVHKGHVPTGIIAGVFSTSAHTYVNTSQPGIKVKSTTKAWRNMGSIPVAGHYVSGHVVKVGFAVVNPFGPADFDLRHMRLTVTYYVLQ